MYKNFVKQVNSNIQHSTIINPALIANNYYYASVIEASVQYEKLLSRTNSNAPVILEFYFNENATNAKTLRNKLTFQTSVYEEISKYLFWTDQKIIPYGWSLQYTISNLLSGESLLISFLYNELYELTIDELAARYL